MQLGEGLHQREAQAEAAAGARERPLALDEGLEEPVEERRVDPRALVPHPDLRDERARRDREGDCHTFGEIAYHLLNQTTVYLTVSGAR